MGDKFLGVSIGRGLGALKGLICIFPHSPEDEKKKKLLAEARLPHTCIENSTRVDCAVCVRSHMTRLYVSDTKGKSKKN